VLPGAVALKGVGWGASKREVIQGRMQDSGKHQVYFQERRAKMVLCSCSAPGKRHDPLGCAGGKEAYSVSFRSLVDVGFVA